MRLSLKDRHLFGAGAAACAVCCAAPVLTVLGVAGAAATIGTVVFAGTVFGFVVALGALLAWWSQRRKQRPCGDGDGDADSPVVIELSPTIRSHGP